MSKPFLRINKEMYVPHSYSMKNFYKNKRKNSLSPKDNSNFTKVTGSGTIGIFGQSPVVVYKKKVKEKQNKEKYELKKQMKNNNYISDGGLKKKIERYNNGLATSPISSPKNKLKTNKGKYRNNNLLIGDNQNNKMSSPRSTKNSNIFDMQLFSKTVRESNKKQIFEKMKSIYKSRLKNKNLNKTKSEEESKKLEEKRLEDIKQLYENGIANEIRKYQVERSISPKDIQNERKKICLLDNGVTFENELNDIEEEEISKINIKETPIEPKSTKTTRLIKSRSEFNQNFKSIDTQSLSPRSKRIYKPSVNQFEFIQKIKQEQQKLSGSTIKTKRKINRINSYLNDSFRHENNKNNNDENILSNNYINNKKEPIYIQRQTSETLSTNDNYPYSHKISHRSPKELKDFKKSKKMKEKELKNIKEREYNTKLFIRFKNLYNLSMRDLSESQYHKIQPPHKGKMTKSKSNTNYNFNGNSIRKKKELNEYYIGGDHSIKNNSTLVNQNEYFLHILESQQLLVNSKFKKVDYISDTESKDENEENVEENENSNLNISKEQIRKITEKESKKSEDSLIKNTNESNSSYYDNLKKKIDSTLKRVGKVFSKENIKDKKDKDNDNNKINSSDTYDDMNLEEINNEDKESESNNLNNNKIEDEIKIENNNNNDKKNSTIHHENKKDLKVKTQDLNIDINNVGNKITTSELMTKEKNIPSLSHTYSTNSNQNKKVEIEIEPRAVLNLVEIIKFIIQRKIFVKLYESYINHSIIQQYSVAFSYFVAICKHYPYRKIEEYANYKTYNYAFRQLFRPYTRKAFKYFVNNIYMRRKLEYLVALLTKMFKFKILEKIYLYNQIYEGDNQKIFKMIITKILSTLIKPHLKQTFDILKEISKQKKDNKNKDNDLTKEKEDIKEKENIKDKKGKEDKKEKEDIKDKKDKKEEKEDKKEKKENFKKIKNNRINKKTEDEDSENNLEDDKSDNDIYKNCYLNAENSSIIDKQDSSVKKTDKNIKNEIFFENESNDDIEDDDKSALHRRADVSMKMNSFMHYTSDDESKSSISIEPNSLDNDKLHRLKKMIDFRNKILYGVEDDNDLFNFEYDGLNLGDNSIDSELHKLSNLKDYLNNKKKLNKTISDKIGDNSSQKSNSKSNRQNDSQHSKNNNIKKQIFENSKLKNEKNEKIDKNEKNDIQTKPKNNENENNISKKEDKDDNNKSNKDINNRIEEDKKIDDKTNGSKTKEDIEEEKEEKSDKNSVNNVNNDKENKKIKKEDIKKNIKIEIDDIPNIKNDISNKHSSSEIDISAGNDANQNIDWEYNLSSSEIKKNENKKEIKDDDLIINDLKDNPINNNEKELKKNLNKDLNKINDDVSSVEDFSIEDNDDDKKDKPNLINDNINQEKAINSKQDNTEPKIDLNNDDKDKEKEKVKEKENLIEEDEKEKSIINNNVDNVENKEKDKDNDKDNESKIMENIKKIKSIKKPEKFSDELTDEIIKDIIVNEIKSNKKKLVPIKKFKFDKFDKMNNNTNSNNSLTNSFGSLGDMLTNSSNMSKEFSLQLSLHDEFLSLNESLMSNYSANSVFNKTIKDHKKEQSLKLYLNKVAPKLIKILYKEICDKYPLIYNNISKPLENNSEKFMVSLALQDTDMLKNNYRRMSNVESIEKIIDKENILKKFSVINKKIRNKDNVISDNFYDNILNDCIIDTAIELINKERIYGKNGKPLKWSSRTHELVYKFGQNEAKRFANYICKSIIRLLHRRIGLITDNYEFLTTDQINMEKDKRLLYVLKKDFNDNKNQWNNFELEETQLKIESTESILDQLYNEIIEILEHIQFSRLRPELYQNKSIYACEEIPKLSFQQTTTEDLNEMEDGDDNVINI